MEFIFFVLIPVIGSLLTIGVGLLAGAATLAATLAYFAGIGYVLYRIVQWLVAR